MICLVRIIDKTTNGEVQSYAVRCEVESEAVMKAQRHFASKFQAKVVGEMTEDGIVMQDEVLD